MQFVHEYRHRSTFYRTFLLAAVLLATSITVSSATLTVTTLNDIGPGSLRQAIADAAPGDKINFSVTGAINLAAGQLVVDKNLTIQGPEASLLSVSGINASRVFYVNSGVTVTLDGMTIRNGDADDGAGITNRGSLTVSNCTVSENRAVGDGGGITNWGTLTVINTTVFDNATGSQISYGDGGGIRNAGELTIYDSNISGNAASYYSSAEGRGGGIFHDSGALTITNSTITGNIARGGGGIYNRATVFINNSTISGNETSYDSVGETESGAGIWTIGTLIATNSTISNNNAYSYWSCVCSGGISANGIDTLINSIVAGNTVQGTNIVDIVGIIGTARHNLIGDAASSGGIQNGVNGNIVGFDPMLGPLANNGGPTFTHALLPGSLAINAGDNCVLIANGCGYTHPALTTDQRGRPRRGNVDMGSFEFYSSPIRCTNCRL